MLAQQTEVKVIKPKRADDNKEPEADARRIKKMGCLVPPFYFLIQIKHIGGGIQSQSASNNNPDRPMEHKAFFKIIPIGDAFKNQDGDQSGNEQTAPGKLQCELQDMAEVKQFKNQETNKISP